MNLHHERLLILLDHYQRTTVDTLQWAKTVQDAAFTTALTLDQHAVLVNGMVEAVNASSQALASLRALLATNPDVPAGPSMAAPIVRLN